MFHCLIVLVFFENSNMPDFESSSMLCSLRERTINCWSRASPSSRSATILSKKNQSWKPERLLGRRRRGSSNHESIFPELTVTWHARNRNVWIHQRPEITNPELPIDECAGFHNWCGDYYRVLPRVLLLLFSYSNRSFLHTVYIPHLTLIAHLTQPLNLQCSASLLSLVYLTILLTRKLECPVISAPLLTIENVAISDGDLVQYVSYSSLKIRKYSSRKLWTWKHLWEKVETFLRKVEM